MSDNLNFGSLKISKEDLKKEVQDVILFFKNYIRNPIAQIRNIPLWSWPKILIVQAIATACIGALSGFIEKSFYGLTNIFIMPVFTMIVVSVWTLFFYYVFQLFLGLSVSFRKLYTLIILANIPYLVFQVLSTIVPPMTLVGLCFSALLLIVGFTENFSITRKFAVRLIAGVYIVLALIWAFDRLERLQEMDFDRNPSFIPEVKLGQ